MKVFCWLGWKEAISVWPERQFHFESMPESVAGFCRGWEIRGQMLSKAILPNATTTRTCLSNSSSRARYGLQLATSSGCGLFSGGAQWSTAVM